MLERILNVKNISIEELADGANVPYEMLKEMLSGNHNISACQAEYVNVMAEYLSIDNKMLWNIIQLPDISFELFRSEMSHRWKYMCDDFIDWIVSNDIINCYWELEMPAESFYLLVILDKETRKRNMPFLAKYNDKRRLKLAEPLYPSSIRLLAKLNDVTESSILDEHDDYDRDFMAYNIVESGENDVV